MERRQTTALDTSKLLGFKLLGSAIITSAAKVGKNANKHPEARHISLLGSKVGKV
ncbi:MAG: hypothetical protein V7721_12270 [Porticoccaceae bacterium]